jgi:hypothetical protein
MQRGDAILANYGSILGALGSLSVASGSLAGLLVLPGAIGVGVVSFGLNVSRSVASVAAWSANPSAENRRQALEDFGGALASGGAVAIGLGVAMAAAGIPIALGVGAAAGVKAGIALAAAGIAIRESQTGSIGEALFDAWTYARDFGAWVADIGRSFSERWQIRDSVSDFFNDARNWAPARDPFALDLDGDGIETTGDMGRTTVLFDHDGDGILSGTGWLRGDDAWLVLDRDGDNRITSGAELFGVDTPLASGAWDTVTLANTQRTIFRDGFSAIAPLDTNRDGRIDASDGAVSGWSIRRDLNADGVIGANETRLAQASDLRIWRDANVNGRVDSGELMSFTEANVVSINVNRAWQGRTALGNGNELIATGSYTRSDNTTRGTGALNLGVHGVYRSFIAPQNVASTATALPALNGSGAVADLQVAASSSGTLASVLSTYAAQTTRTGQLALLDGLIGEWAATSSIGTARENGAYPRWVPIGRCRVRRSETCWGPSSVASGDR